MDSYRPQQPPLRKTGAISGAAPRRGPAVGLADHLIGWLFGGGVLLVTAGLFWLTRRPRRTGA